jgi:hypothetical protein
MRAISSSVAGRFAGVLAHHEGADRGMPGEGDDVRHHAVALEHREILGEALELPADAGAQRVQRHALDLGQVAHREIAVRGLARRDAEAAIADHDGRHAERRRRIRPRIPGELRVVMRVAVDDARHQRQPAGIDRLRAAPELVADRRDASAADGEIARRAGAPVPSIRSASRMTRSNMGGSSLAWAA